MEVSLVLRILEAPASGLKNLLAETFGFVMVVVYIMMCWVESWHEHIDRSFSGR